jgi:hypothetical protein
VRCAAVRADATWHETVHTVARRAEALPAVCAGRTLSVARCLLHVAFSAVRRLHVALSAARCLLHVVCRTMRCLLRWRTERVAGPVAADCCL